MGQRDGCPSAAGGPPDRARVGGVLGQRTREAQTLAVIAGSLWCWAAGIASWLGGTYSFAPVWRTGVEGKESEGNC